MGRLGIRSSENAHLLSLVKGAIGSKREADIFIDTRTGPCSPSAWPAPPAAGRRTRHARPPESPDRPSHLEAGIHLRAPGRMVTWSLNALTTPPCTPVTGPRVARRYPSGNALSYGEPRYGRAGAFRPPSR